MIDLVLPEPVGTAPIRLSGRPPVRGADLDTARDRYSTELSGSANKVTIG